MVLFHHLEISYVLIDWRLCTSFFLLSDIRARLSQCCHLRSYCCVHAPLSQSSPASLAGVLEGTAQLRDGGSWCKLHQVLPPSIHPTSLVLGTKASVLILQFPGSPLSSLLRLPVAEGFLQLLGTCSDLFHPLKKVESGLTLPTAGFLSTLDTSCLVLRLRWVEISQDS